LRFRKDAPVEAGDVKVRVDILFRPLKVAIFVDGCFWHQCPQHGTLPKLNAEFWRTKLQSNVSRDRRVDAALREHGWLVVRCWEHESIDDATNRILTALMGRAGN
jgi:DNA mismatch endonuclease, patch repair protein